MKMRTVCLAPGRIPAGAEVALPVTGMGGKILLAPGAALDAQIVENLCRRGVEAVFVRIHDDRDEATVARELAEAKSRVNQIFRGEGSTARNELKAAVLYYRREATR